MDLLVGCASYKIRRDHITLSLAALSSVEGFGVVSYLSSVRSCPDVDRDV